MILIESLTITEGNVSGVVNRENLTLHAVEVTNNTKVLGTGGGINHAAGRLVVSNSTLTGNRAKQGAAIEVDRGGTAEIVNSTISGNTASGGGGGIVVTTTGKVEIRNSTITNNRSQVNGDLVGPGGGIWSTASSVTLHNTIVAGNFRGTADTTSDLAGPVNSTSSHNLIGNFTVSGGLAHGDNGNILGDGGTAVLPISRILNTTLSDNGGPTRTHVLVFGSPAINAGDDAAAIDVNRIPLATDQRGGAFSRLLDGVGNGHTTVDMGAIETSPITGDVDGDTDFDANDSFLIHLVKLAGSDAQLDQSKGSTSLTVAQLRTNISQLGSLADVDGDGDFDANDSFLIHIIKLSGTNTQIEQSKGGSSLTAVQIRTNINALDAQATTSASTPPESQVLQSVTPVFQKRT
ncbi:MAG TPA: hypothetical protein EYG03_29855 [Planctomycetes bacterium]|nr:hypothetical protein [Fuerstiella sp.]HIK96169.1 hypothetical protein [Planctomycetota bacterium]